jgi:hypothetical protein
MGILVHDAYDDVGVHKVPAACPWPVHLADAAATALKYASSTLTNAQKAVANTRVTEAKRYVPTSPATYNLWAALNLMK